MEYNIDYMIAIRLQPTEIEVEITVGENCKGAVRFVAFFARHGSTPKIVLEERPEGSFGCIQVVIGENTSVVVEYEVSIQGTPITQKRHCKNKRGRDE